MVAHRGLCYRNKDTVGIIKVMKEDVLHMHDLSDRRWRLIHQLIEVLDFNEVLAFEGYTATSGTAAVSSILKGGKPR